MATALIVTVGGSHQPVLKAIQTYRPDRVYFLCSADSQKLIDGPGNVIKSRFDLERPDQPNVITQLKLLPEQVHIDAIDRVDDLNTCYLKAAELLTLARQQFPGCRLLADYTAGTKSMSAGLAAAALDHGDCELSVVSGSRIDLVRVVDRTELVKRLRLDDVQVRRRLQAADLLIRRYDYSAALQILRDTAAELNSPGNEARVQRGITLCQALDDWDRFDHVAARGCLEAYQREFVAHWRVLKALCGETTGHGFERVEDLYRNAERRAAQGRYDDAVGRVYRAIELTAQIWLQQRYQIDTGNVDPAKVPEASRAWLETRRKDGRKPGEAGQIKIGLADAWQLTTEFADDPVGEVYRPRQKSLMSFLTVRNQSLFAHGDRPITQAQYTSQVPEVWQWLLEAIAAGVAAQGRRWDVKLEQFPTQFLLQV